MNTNLLLIAVVLTAAVLAPTAAAMAAPATAMPADASAPASAPAPCTLVVCEIFNDLFCPWLACVA